MQEKLLSSVRVFSLNKEKILIQLKKKISDFTKDRPEIKKVILFGSLVKGNYTPFSDADIIIVLYDNAEVSAKIRDRIPDYYIDDMPIPTDVFPYKEKELEKKISEGSFFIKDAINKGQILFSRN